ncbi:QRFP-like peptide receptor [Branchiostoma lanceolatum]|uniref:QRFP-like peptide receptor n=1 Tax=Branchiostoma lanceolatum TaxID=7740 RepID=UPI0034559A2A
MFCRAEERDCPSATAKMTDLFPNATMSDPGGWDWGSGPHDAASLLNSSIYGNHTNRLYAFPGFEYPTSAETTVKIIVYALVFLIALVGNATVICIVLVTKTMWTPTNFYIMNLAVADLLIAVFCMWIHLVEDQTANWIFGDFMCRFNTFIQGVSVVSGILTMVVIAMDRFFAIIFPLKARVTDTNAAVVVAMIWTASIATNIPLLVVLEQSEHTWGDGYREVWCREIWPDYERQRAVYTIFLFVVIYTLPLLIISGAYAMIAKTLWNKKTPGVTIVATESAQAKTKRKVIRMMVVVVLAFFICWTPYQILQLYIEFTDDSKRPSWFPDLRYSVVLLGYANSACNPIIYNGFSENFRKGFWDVLKLRCLRRNRVEPTVPPNQNEADNGRHDLQLRIRTVETVSAHV